MSDTLSINLVPGYLPNDDELITPAILRALARPTVTLAGSLGATLIADGAVTTPKLADGALSADTTGRNKMADGFVTDAKLNATQDWSGKTLSGTPTVNWSSATFTPPPGWLVKFTSASSAARTVVNTTIPLDNTTPLNTEGQLLLTASHTPRASTNLLRVRAVIPIFIPIQGYAIAALFNDTTCVAATRMGVSNADSQVTPMVLEYLVVAGGTSAITFNLRVGSANHGSYSVYVNGDSSAGVFNGLSTALLTIEEITAP